MDGSESDEHNIDNEMLVNKNQTTMLTPSPPPPHSFLPGGSLPSSQNNVADKNFTLPPNSFGQSSNSNNNKNIAGVPFNRHQLYDGVAPRPPAKSNSVHPNDSTSSVPITLPEFPRNTLNLNGYHNGGRKGESYPTIVNERPTTSSQSENKNWGRLGSNKNETSESNSGKNANETAICNGDEKNDGRSYSA